MKSSGIAKKAVLHASQNSSRFFGFVFHASSFILPQTCSMSFMSGDWAGQSWSTLIFFALRNFDVEMEVCDGAPSCCKIWPHGFLIVIFLVSGHSFDHGGHVETEFDKLFWLTQGLQVTRSRGALLQWKRGWPWIFEPTNGPPERLSCGVCLTWACQKCLQSLHIFFLSSVLDAETH